MSQQKEWKWNARKELAAQLLAQGEITKTEICQRVKIAPVTLYRWQESPEFNERVDRIFQLLRQHLYQKSLAISKARAEWRERFLERVIGQVDDMTVEEWRATKRRPIAAITIALRLQASVDAHHKQKELDEEKNGLRAPFDPEEQAEFDAARLPFWAVAGEEAQRLRAQHEPQTPAFPSQISTPNTQHSSLSHQPEPMNATEVLRLSKDEATRLELIEGRTVLSLSKGARNELAEGPELVEGWKG